MNIVRTKPQLLWICAAIIIAAVLVTQRPSALAVEPAMPGTINIDAIQNKYGPVTFDHAMHAGIAESCAKCHHQHNDKAVAACKECHTIESSAFKASAKQGFLPCSGCHSEYSPDSLETPGLKVALHKKCFQCHIGIGKLGVSPVGCIETCHSKK